jgi:glycosyltransferase involved in cell wall biosynthesis
MIYNDRLMTQTLTEQNQIGISIVIPAYNEAQAIREVLEQINGVCIAQKIDFEIIVVDDGSTDRTVEVLETANVHLLRHPENRGYGAAIQTGVLSSQYPWILITDADGTYPISQIPRLMVDMDHYEMIVGARTGQDVNIPLVRRPAKWLLSKLANFMAQTHIPDLNSGFRLFRKTAFQRFVNLFPSGFSLTTTITLALLCNGYAVRYVPVDYYKRKGSSKIRPIRDTYNFFLLVIRTIMYFDPLRIFAPLALFLLLLGMLFAGYEIYRFQNITTTAAIILFAGLQTGILGLLADLIVKGRR